MLINRTIYKKYVPLCRSTNPCTGLISILRSTRSFMHVASLSAGSFIESFIRP